MNRWKNYKWYQKAIFIVVSLDFTILNIIIIALLGKNTKWYLLILAVLLMLFTLKMSMNSHFLKKKSTNLFIFGAKGDGKDMIMEKSVYLKYDTHTPLKYLLNRNRKKPLANDDFGYGTKVIEPKDVFNLAPNTYANLIEQDIKIIQKNHDFEGRDYYLTDSAIYFPSQEDSKLNKEYPSFPLFYATSRHLYDMNIIVNTQVNSRLWKKLREQVQDGYIEALGVVGWGTIPSSIPLIRNYVLIRARYYSKLETAEMGLLPFNKVAVLNKVMDKTIYMTTAGATEEQYKAMYGTIKELVFIMNKKHVLYDTRIFHEKFFGVKAKDMKLLEAWDEAIQEDKERTEQSKREAEKSLVAMAEKT